MVNRVSPPGRRTERERERGVGGGGGGRGGASPLVFEPTTPPGGVRIIHESSHCGR